MSSSEAGPGAPDPAERPDGGEPTTTPEANGSDGEPEMDDLDHRRAPRRGRRWSLVALALVAGVAATYYGYTTLGSTPIEGQRVSYAERPGNAMAVTVDVLREDPARPGVCIVRVRDLSGAESGRKEIYVPPRQDRLTTVVRSIGRPVTADVFGCSYEVPEYLSTPERPTG